MRFANSNRTQLEKSPSSRLFSEISTGSSENLSRSGMLQRRRYSRMTNINSNPSLPQIDTS